MDSQSMSSFSSSSTSVSSMLTPARPKPIHNVSSMATSSIPPPPCFSFYPSSSKPYANHISNPWDTEDAQTRDIIIDDKPFTPGRSFQSSSREPWCNTSQRDPALVYRPQKDESRCLQMIMPGLFVAFQDDSVAFGEKKREELTTPNGEEFTHIISLSTHGDAVENIQFSVDDYTHAKRLHLFLPPKPYHPYSSSFELTETQLLAAQQFFARSGRKLSPDDIQALLSDEMHGDGVTGLNVDQLLAARDFLSSSGYNISIARPDRYVRLLITTPRDRRTDAISAVACYLSFASGYTVKEILRFHDLQRGLLRVWQGVVSGYGVDFVNEVAQL